LLDPVSTSLNYGLKIIKLCEELKGLTNQLSYRDEREQKYLTSIIENCGASIRRRAVDLPGMITQLDLVPTLTFYISKLDKNDVNIITILINYLESDQKLEVLIKQHVQSTQSRREEEKKDSFEKTVKNIIKEVSEESKGYAIMLSIVVSLLRSIYTDQRERLKPGPEILKNLAQFLKEIREGRTYNEIIVSGQLTPFLLEFKKICQGFFGE
jgi:CRISPR/Cas system CMR-associated protein Cmr5 small subunit